MNRADILNSIPNQDDKLLISRILDQIRFCETRNRITHSNFLDIRQKNLILKLLFKIKLQNFICFGGFENAERTCIIFIPNKFNQNFVMNNIDDILSLIRIYLPKELYNTYSHKNYLRRNYETWN